MILFLAPKPTITTTTPNALSFNNQPKIINTTTPNSLPITRTVATNTPSIHPALGRPSIPPAPADFPRAARPNFNSRPNNCRPKPYCRPNAPYPPPLFPRPPQLMPLNAFPIGPPGPPIPMLPPPPIPPTIYLKLI